MEFSQAVLTDRVSAGVGERTHVDGALTLTWASGGPKTLEVTGHWDNQALIDGSQLTFSAGGMALIFRK